MKCGEHFNLRYNSAIPDPLFQLTSDLFCIGRVACERHDAWHTRSMREKQQSNYGVRHFASAILVSILICYIIAQWTTVGGKPTANGTLLFHNSLVIAARGMSQVPDIEDCYF